MPPGKRPLNMKPAEITARAKKLMKESTDVTAASTKLSAKTADALSERNGLDSMYRHSLARNHNAVQCASGLNAFADEAKFALDAISGSLRLLAEATAQAVGATVELDEHVSADAAERSVPSALPIRRPKDGVPLAGVLTGGPGMTSFAIGSLGFVANTGLYSKKAVAALVTGSARGVAGAVEATADGLGAASTAAIRGILGGGEFLLDGAAATVGATARAAVGVPVSVAESVVGVAGAAVRGVEGTASNIVDLGADGLSLLAHGAGSVLSWFDHDAGQGVIRAGDGVNAAITGVSGAARDLTDTVTDAASKVTHWAGSSARWAVDNTTDAVHAATDRSTDFLTWAADKGTDGAFWALDRSTDAGTWVTDRSTNISYAAATGVDAAVTHTITGVSR
jgi:hypothetical protein